MLFTPRLKNGIRLKLNISKADSDRFNKLSDRSRAKVSVTDMTTGNKYSVRRASCGLNCYCDAVAEPIE